MKYIKLLYTIMIISCSASFETKDNFIKEYQNIIRIDIDGGSIPDTVDVSDIIDSIKIVKIKETDDGLFGGIEKLILTKENYVIYDPHYSNKIILFKDNGEFHRNLVKMGSGPDEMSKLSDVWVNENGELEVYDNYLNKIITYDAKLDVKETNIFKHNNYFGSIIRFPGKTQFVAFAGYNGFLKNNEFHKIAIIDSGFVEISHFFPYSKSLNHALISTPVNPFYIFNDTIRFAQNFDPSIYNILPDGELLKKYELTYNPTPFPIDFEKQLVIPNINFFKSELIDFAAMNKIFSGYVGYKGPWLETSKFAIFSSFDFDYDATFTSIYDKDRMEILYQARNFTESDRYHMQIPPHFYTTGVFENRFISCYEGFIVLMLLKKSSPFYDMVQNDIESYYIIDIKLK